MDKEKLERIRHSCEHVLTMAMMRLWPGQIKAATGPATDEGFYFDFDTELKITEENFEKIEEEMAKIIKEDLLIIKDEMTAEEAKKFFGGNTYKDNQYKHEWLDLIEARNEKISVYWMGERGQDMPQTFVDICSGPHAKSTGEIKAFKLLKTAGAYWHGDEKNKMLTRIYGTAFESQEDLDSYLLMLEEAKKRDHKILGPALDLFTFSDLVGPGLPLWTPRGTVLRNILDNFVWQLRQKHGYLKVEIPHITKKDLYVTSGHWEKYKDDLFKITTREGHEFAMKPMNCPHHTQIYARQLWSYRELPQRYANTTTCYRDEQTGELSGLSRVRAFAQDDAHVFCRLSQAKEEFLKIWDVVHEFYPAFGFNLRVRLSLHDPANPEKYLGDKDRWTVAEKVLREIVEEKKVDWFEGVGEAAFYGPKLDFMAKDAIGREWQMATIQLDMNMPERFDLVCINEKGEKERIVMIHAAIMGSLERFLSILIEHTIGAFPMWLAPEQIRLATVGSDFIPFAKELLAKLETAGLRVGLDESDEKVGKKIRNSAMMKIPWTIVIGAKEVEGSDFKINVFGQDEDLIISAAELVTKALEAGKIPR